MKQYTVNEVLANFNEQDILTRNEYTFVEYVEQLMKFQEAIARMIMDKEDVNYVRITEIISHCEAMVREKNLYSKQEVMDGIRVLKLFSKEISVAMAGKKGEDRVANTFQYVTRPDAEFFRNVFIADDTEETEIDSIVLTKNGFIILEIKNAKENITLAPDGRVLFNNSSCYHDISIGEKMDKKRRLLKERLEHEFARNKIEKEVKIDSLIVFSTPNGVRIRVHDKFKQENYCCRGSLYNRIDSFYSTIQYTDAEFLIMKEILQQIETEQKRFALTFNPEEVKKAFAEAYEVLSYAYGSKNRKSIEDKVIIKKNSTFLRWVKKYSESTVAASLVAVTGVAFLAASRIYK